MPNKVSALVDLVERAEHCGEMHAQLGAEEFAKRQNTFSSAAAVRARALKHLLGRIDKEAVQALIMQVSGVKNAKHSLLCAR